MTHHFDYTVIRVVNLPDYDQPMCCWCGTNIAVYECTAASTNNVHHWALCPDCSPAPRS